MFIPEKIVNTRELAKTDIVGIRISYRGNDWFVDVKRKDGKFKPTFMTGNKKEIILKLSKLFNVNIKIES